MLIKRTQKHLNLLEKPIKMVKIYTKYGQNIEAQDFFDLKIVPVVTRNKLHDLLKKPLKIVKIYSKYAKIYKGKFKKSASSSHIQTT